MKLEEEPSRQACRLRRPQLCRACGRNLRRTSFRVDCPRRIGRIDSLAGRHSLHRTACQPDFPLHTSRNACSVSPLVEQRLSIFQVALAERGCRAERAGESASCVKILSLADLKVLLHLQIGGVEANQS